MSDHVTPQHPRLISIPDPEDSSSETSVPIVYQALPLVRHASELTPELIQQFPYDLQFEIHSLLESPEDLVMLARVSAHNLDITRLTSHHQLVEQLSAAGFIRDDLDQPTARIIWLYQIVSDAPKGWFNQVYEMQTNLDPTFIGEIVTIIDSTFDDSDIASQVKERFGLLPEQLANLENAASAASAPSRAIQPYHLQGRSGMYYHRLAIALPSFHGLGGPAPDRVNELLTELTQLLEQNCLPDAKVGYCRQRLRKLADMSYGPDLRELERAYRQPLSQLWLRPETYGTLHELGFETVGDVIANYQALVSDHLPITESVINRFILFELRDSLRCHGYTLDLPSLSVAEP